MVTQKFRPSTSRFDELLSFGYEGLIKAADRFDFSRGIKFSTFACRYIWGHIQYEFTRQKRKGHVILESEMFGTENGESTFDPPDTRNDTKDNECDQIWKTIQCALLPRQYDILRLYFVEGQTLLDIGNKYGIGRERVRQIIEKAKGRLVDEIPNLRELLS